ncbi:MAG: hypothetical protein NTV05_11310 [Acidobacteria bacterium]|nr:hypothetical protein [Acidobacteriota bacterium]
MRNQTVRVLLVAIAVAALAAAGYQAWSLDQQARADRASITEFETRVRGLSQSLAEIGATQRGYVAEGQNSERWQTQLTQMMADAVSKLTDLRTAAGTPEAQGALEAAIETMASFGKADQKARNYVSSGQGLSASDVIFADGHDLLNKAIASVEEARLHETARHEAAAATARRTQMFYVGGALGLTLVILIALVPTPKTQDGRDPMTGAESGSGLGLSHPSSGVAGKEATRTPAATSAWPAGQDRANNLAAAADICASLARVQSTRELPALLERVAGALDATGVIIWMPNGPPGLLHPVLAHGYASATLARMGAIGSDADNATATAYRTRTVQTMPAEPLSGGALVVPLVTAEGCTGAMAIELKKNVEPTDAVRAVATILAAQLATLITPAPSANAPPAGSHSS